jgi:hypothetical protein
MVHRNERTGARHILHDDLWMAGDVLGPVFGNQPRIGVVAAAWRGADDHADGLVLEEWLLRLRG